MDMVKQMYDKYNAINQQLVQKIGKFIEPVIDSCLTPLLRNGLDSEQINLKLQKWLFKNFDFETNLICGTVDPFSVIPNFIQPIGETGLIQDIFLNNNGKPYKHFWLEMKDKKIIDPIFCRTRRLYISAKPIYYLKPGEG